MNLTLYGLAVEPVQPVEFLKPPAVVEMITARSNKPLVRRGHKLLPKWRYNNKV